MVCGGGVCCTVGANLPEELECCRCIYPLYFFEFFLKTKFKFTESKIGVYTHSKNWRENKIFFFEVEVPQYL